jgi:hypothetical protein
MAETITIPSPSVFLEPSPLDKPTPLGVGPSKANASGKPKASKSDGTAKRKHPAAKPAMAPKEEAGKIMADGGARTKTKQSKSRNGEYILVPLKFLFIRPVG